MKIRPGGPTTHERWANLRFSVVGHLLAAPPPHGELQAELERLAAKQWRHPVTNQLAREPTDGTRRAEQRLDEREIRSYESEYVNGLWHLDFHFGSKKVLVARGEYVTPVVLGILDDYSRLACHLQWYFAENAENLVH